MRITDPQQMLPSLSCWRVGTSTGTLGQILGGKQLLTSSTCAAGFNLLCTYRAHRNRIRQVAYNPHQGHFVSIDEMGMRSWKVNPQETEDPATLSSLNFPGLECNYVTCLIYASAPMLFFCACLDGHLRIYKHDLSIKACLPWQSTFVLDMAFCEKRDELVVAGCDGVKVPPPASLQLPLAFCGASSSALISSGRIQTVLSISVDPECTVQRVQYLWTLQTLLAPALGALPLVERYPRYNTGR